MPVSTPAIPIRASMAKPIRTRPLISLRTPFVCALACFVVPVLLSFRGVDRFDCTFCPPREDLPFFSSAISNSKIPFLSYTLALYYTISTYESISNILKNNAILPVLTLIACGLPSLAQVHVHDHVPKGYKIAHPPMHPANIVAPHSHSDSPVHSDSQLHVLIV